MLVDKTEVNTDMYFDWPNVYYKHVKKQKRFVFPQSYHFLDLLQVLCVCDGVAIPNNQSYIVQQWLRTYKVNSPS